MEPRAVVAPPAGLTLTDLDDDSLRHVAAVGGFEVRALLLAVCRGTRDAVRVMRWPVDARLPSDRRLVLTGGVTLVGGRLVGVPDEQFTGGMVDDVPGNHYVKVKGPGTVVTLRDVAVRGVGFWLERGSRLVLEGCEIDAAPFAALRVGKGCAAEVSGGRISGAGGCGVTVRDGELLLTRAEVLGSASHGISCSGEGSRCRVQGGEVSGSGNVGGWAGAGASVTLESLRASGNRLALMSDGDGTRVEVLGGCQMDGVSPGVDLSDFCQMGGTVAVFGLEHTNDGW